MTHERSCWRQFISLCSVCQGIHHHEPHKETHRDSYCGESITLWSVWYHLKSYASKITYHCALCDIGFTFSHCMNKHMKLHPVKSSYQCALCGKWFISWKNKQWHMKSHAGDNPYICALCNQKPISRNYPQRHNTGHAMVHPYPYQGIHLHQPPKRHINMNNGKFNITVLFNIQELLQEIISFGNGIGRQKTSWEYPATQSLQHTLICCWWKLVINNLCSTNFV